jgi:hypothetical protein
MRLNVAMLLGILLIAAGAIGLALKGIDYTSQETILEIGPIEATAETTKTYPIPVWASGLVLGLGVLILVAGVRGRPS